MVPVAARVSTSMRHFLGAELYRYGRAVTAQQGAQGRVRMRFNGHHLYSYVQEKLVHCTACGGWGQEQRGCSRRLGVVPWRCLLPVPMRLEHVTEAEVAMGHAARSQG